MLVCEFGGAIVLVVNLMLLKINRYPLKDGSNRRTTTITPCGIDDNKFTVIMKKLLSFEQGQVF